MSDCWTAHFWVRDRNGIIYCQRCGVWYTQPWTAVDAPCLGVTILVSRLLISTATAISRCYPGTARQPDGLSSAASAQGV